MECATGPDERNMGGGLPVCIALWVIVAKKAKDEVVLVLVK